MVKSNRRLYFGRNVHDSEVQNKWLEERRELLKIALFYEGHLLYKINKFNKDDYGINVSIFEQKVSDNRRNSFSLKEYNELIFVLKKANKIDANKDLTDEIGLIEYLFSLAERYIKLHEYEQGMRNLLASTDWVFDGGQDDDNDLFGIIQSDIQSDIQSELAEEEVFYSDGAVIEYYGKRFERKPANKEKAIKIHGLSCIACGFNFGQTYGSRGENYIEIHHINPLSTVKHEVVINPETDLVPVCANCHRMIHRHKDNVLTIDELKRLLAEQRNNLIL